MKESDTQRPELAGGTVETELRCPQCGGGLEVRLAFSTPFCGIRAVAACRSGCRWSQKEQLEMDAEASDELFA
ncbi:MAG: hypothetical protein AB1640_23405 [bacterium]